MARLALQAVARIWARASGLLWVFVFPDRWDLGMLPVWFSCWEIVARCMH